MKIIKFILSILGIGVVLFITLLGYLVFTEYKPEDVEVIEENNSIALDKNEFKILTWNIGYGGLDKTQDFFMDGGTMVNPKYKSKVEENISSFVEEIKKVDPDFLLVQEMDLNSKRSFNINQREIFDKNLNMDSQFAYNFNVNYVPYPFPPIGKVKGGLYTASKYEAESSKRISLPVPFKFPVRLANLKRCLLLNEYPLNNGKKLILINLHLEAYDGDGSGNKAQSEMLLKIFDEEYAKGNYIIAGGDWNQELNLSENKFKVNSKLWKPRELNIHTDKYKILADTSTPTYRVNNQPYVKDSENTFIGTIDGYLVTPNVEEISIDNLDFEFEHSDHNPVLLNVKLN